MSQNSVLGLGETEKSLLDGILNQLIPASGAIPSADAFDPHSSGMPPECENYG